MPSLRSLRSWIRGNTGNSWSWERRAAHRGQLGLALDLIGEVSSLQTHVEYPLDIIRKDYRKGTQTKIAQKSQRQDIMKIPVQNITYSKYDVILYLKKVAE